MKISVNYGDRNDLTDTEDQMIHLSQEDIVVINIEQGNKLQKVGKSTIYLS